MAGAAQSARVRQNCPAFPSRRQRPSEAVASCNAVSERHPDCRRGIIFLKRTGHALKLRNSYHGESAHACFSHFHFITHLSSEIERALLVSKRRHKSVLRQRPDEPLERAGLVWKRCCCTKQNNGESRWSLSLSETDCELKLTSSNLHVGGAFILVHEPLPLNLPTPPFPPQVPPFFLVCLTVFFPSSSAHALS